MARVVGVDLPRQKRVEYGLQAVYGIGLTRAREILKATGIDPSTRVRDLRREVMGNIKRLMDINCYKGTRHKRGLPVNGQRTSTNARTRKGPRKIAVKKKKIA